MSSPRTARLVALATLVFLVGATLMPPDTSWVIRLIPELVAAVLALVTWRRPSPASGMALPVTALVASIVAGLFWQGAMAASIAALALAGGPRPRSRCLGAARRVYGR